MRFLSICALALLAAACSTADGPDPLAGYERALVVTDPQDSVILEEGSPEEKRALERVVEFYRVFSADRIRQLAREVYAEDAYLRDPFREVQGIDAVEAYMIESTEPVDEARFEIHDVIGEDGEYYLRWIMVLRLKDYGGDEPDRIVGMSHLRFDRHGKVVFHQDYYDASRVVYEKVPVIGFFIRKIRERI